VSIRYTLICSGSIPKTSAAINCSVAFIPCPTSDAAVMICSLPAGRSRRIAPLLSSVPVPNPVFLNPDAIPQQVIILRPSSSSSWGVHGSVTPSSLRRLSTASRHSGSPALSSRRCPVLVSHPLRSAFNLRNSKGSIPSFSASISMADSMPNIACTTPKPLNAPAGGLLVYIA